jgi:hypothetical protein
VSTKRHWKAPRETKSELAEHASRLGLWSGESRGCSIRFSSVHLPTELPLHRRTRRREDGLPVFLLGNFLPRTFPANAQFGVLARGAGVKSETILGAGPFGFFKGPGL